MDVRIGITLDGQVAGVDTRAVVPLLLVADAGRGKTTTARYLTRWWMANTARHAHVYTEAPSEWADLRATAEHPDHLDQGIGRSCRQGTCLVVVDDIDSINDDRLSLLPLGTNPTILTSHGGSRVTARTLLGTDLRSFGLVLPAHANTVEVAVLEGQGRLDWPIGTIATIPDQRGPLDFPCHRWEMAAVHHMAVAR